MFKRLLKRVRSYLAWRRTKREQELRAVNAAFRMIETGALRRLP